ncbi:MAG: SRPBCC family protein [Alphaproteobacteria bacterium]|nr:SRPBCC family protein [Alphaproteobacteria bacterium]
MMRAAILVLGALMFTGPSLADVTTRSDDAFTLTYERTVMASADAILSTVGRPAAWWSSAHTYSGDAANITLDLRPGGCWCEALPGGGVKHGEVVLIWPEQRMIRFDAPFGPLQSVGAAAVLTVSWADTPGADARRLKWTYVVNGPGVGAMADPIEGVLAEQFTRLATSLGGVSPS